MIPIREGYGAIAGGGVGFLFGELKKKEILAFSSPEMLGSDPAILELDLHMLVALYVFVGAAAGALLMFGSRFNTPQGARV